jgi:DNA sulfur modification protein DndE
MPELTLQRIPFTVEADNQLRMLKARTGIAPNILCRLGLCLSLEERAIPTSIKENAKFGREINRYTLLGKHDKVYTALLLTRLIIDGIPIDEIDKMFLAHINRGVEIMAARVKTIRELTAIQST